MHAFWNSRTKKAVALAAVLALLCPLFLYDADAATLEALSLDANGINSHPILQAGTQGIPDFVPQEQIHQYGHIQRLPALEEGANTLAFLNTDGTVSIYYTSQPLRYTDSAGILRDIDLSLTLENDSYRTVSNAVSMSFARDYRNGISLAYDSDTLRLIAIPPVSTLPGQMDTAEMVTAEATDSILTYRNLFGSGLDVRYTPLYNGIKEDIILAEYTGISEFQFLLYTGGLAVFEDGGRYYAAQSQDAQTRYQIGDVVAYDAQGHISEGTLTVTPVKAGQIYQLTITVDEAFLTGEETAYPVLIDPEITVSDNALGAGAVEDCPVYSGKPNANFGSFQYNGIGYMDSTYQIGRTAVKLSGLISHSTFNELPAAAITSAVFYIKDSSGASGRTIDLYPLTSNPAWTESTLTWNNIGSATVTPLTSATVGGGAQSAFDITALVKHWKSETYDINCGFLLRNANETLSGNFYSTETAVANQPYAVITYNYAGANFSNAINISLNTVYSVSLSTYGERKYFKFTPSATGFYTYESLQRSAGDPSARLYNPNYKQLSYANDSGSDYNFQITYHLIAGQTYYFSAEGCLSGTSNYSIRIRSETSAAQIGASAIAFGSSTNYSEFCIYGRKKDELTGEDFITICPGCRGQISSNITKYPLAEEDS